MKLFNSLGLVTGLLVVIAIAVVFPFLFIWSVNTLFALTIPYTLETWSAVVLLQIFFKSEISFKKG